MPSKPTGESPVTVELVHSEPTGELEQCVFRLQADARYLAEHMTKANARAVLLTLERARDNLSRVIDRAEDK
jgi:hypothetical protein